MTEEQMVKITKLEYFEEKATDLEWFQNALSFWSLYWYTFLLDLHEEKKWKQQMKLNTGPMKMKAIANANATGKLKGNMRQSKEKKTDF